MIIKDLPNEIKQLYYLRCKQQDRNLLPETESMKDCSSSINHSCGVKAPYGLNWGDTTEEHEFWSKISQGDFSDYYSRYPKPMESFRFDILDIGNTMSKTEETKVFKAKLNGKNVKITIEYE